MIPIGNRFICAIEYLDEVIGCSLIVNIEKREKSLVVLFDTNFYLTLTCPCCGDSEHLQLTEEIAQNYRGLVVHSLSYDPEWNGIVIFLSRTPDDEEPLEGAFLTVSLENIRDMKTCLVPKGKLLKEKIYGYSNIKSRNEIGIIPEEASAVEYLFQQFLNLTNTMEPEAALRALLKEVKEKKFPPPPKGWSKKAIEKILSDPIYIGFIKPEQLI